MRTALGACISAALSTWSAIGAAQALPPASDAPATPVATSATHPAQASRSASGTEAARARRSYGWQILVADGAWLTVAVAAGASDSGALAAIAVSGYFVAAPTVHFAHGNVGAGFGSLGLRVAVPLIGGAVGAALSNCGHEQGLGELCPIGPAAVGALIGAAGAIVVDAAFLAREPKGPKAGRGFHVTPGIAVARDSGRMTLGGVF